MTDESETLVSLELTPSSTLVLVPVESHTTAYPATGIPSPWAVVGALGRGVVAVVERGYTVVATVAGAVVGGGAGAQQQQQQQQQGEALGGAGGAGQGRERERQRRVGGGGARVRTLYDEVEQDEGEGEGEGRKTRFYNGNQVSCLSYLG